MAEKLKKRVKPKKATPKTKKEPGQAKAKPKTAKPKATNGKAKKAGLSLAQRRDKIRSRYDRPVVVFEEDTRSTPRYQTRFPRLNKMIGGGFEQGGIIEIYGPEDSGKSSTAIAFAADIQKAAPPDKKTVVLVNFEGPEYYDWWRTLGLDTTETGEHPAFVQLRPKTLEEGMGDLVDLIESGEVCAAIIDSVYAAGSKGSKEVFENWRNPKKGIGTGGGMGVEARQWGVAWTGMKGILQDYGVTVFAVNQIREVIDAGGPPRKSWMGKKTTTPRGKALKFYAWIRIEMRGRVLVDEDGNMRRDEDGKTVRMRIIKNKTSGDQRGIVDYPLIRGFGFDLIADLIATAIEAGAIKQKGGGFYEVGKRKMRGKVALRDWVEGSPKAQAVLGEYVDRWMSKKSMEELSLGEIDEEDDED